MKKATETLWGKAATQLKVNKLPKKKKKKKNVVI